jgi:DNA polymerase III epsilon subunit-like protein
MSEQPPKRRKCGHCRGEGHDRRNCPGLRPTDAGILAIGAVENRNGVAGRPSRPPNAPTAPHVPNDINWEQVCYVLFDLETTGGSRTDDDIIELAAMVLGPDGIALEDGSFDSLIRPKKDVSTFIALLTGISNEMVQSAPIFSVVVVQFFDFINGVVRNFSSSTSTTIEKIILVAHNGRVFDVPFLIRSLHRHDLQNLWEDDRYGYTIDTLQIAERVFHSNATRKPTNFKLGTLYQFVTGNEMENSHRAMSDVKALYTIFRNDLFWGSRKGSVQSSIVDGAPSTCVGVMIPLPTHDSDASDSGSEGDDNDDDGGTTDDDDDEEIVGDHWRTADFTPREVPMQKFTECFTSSCRSGVSRTGLQVSPAIANSPIKAWRLIFTAGILERIVRHTNKYGDRHAKDWTTITKKDLTDFIAVLFAMSIQKRKDKPSNWFSDNPLLESRVAKKITTGRQFGRILRYLHCCDPDETGGTEDGEYDPSYKVLEFKNELEKRWSAIFVPEQQLSLDETLLRAFGRMKFKVRIISKAARYGIKLYVVTDARTSFVLGVIVYTGKFTYTDSRTESTKKTVQVVQQLCEPFRGTHRTIYVDRFYSSIDLLKQLEDMQLYMTGTVLSNRIPKHITIAKSSRQFKTLNRGDAVNHLLKYKTLKGEMKEAGLVAWKDRNMVYCMTNDTSTIPTDECRRRGFGGIIRIKRPEAISKYNRYMGGVDVADMRRLHCNSTIMGLNRWWLKLFFYLLDAGTSNALVVYNEAMGGKQPSCNIADFKAKVVEALVGAKLHDSVDDDRAPEHAMIPIQNGERQRCSYCTMTGYQRRTRFMCEGCGVPYCSIGSGKTDKDCFAIAHDNEQIRELCVRKYQRQQTHTRKQVLKNR